MDDGGNKAGESVSHRAQMLFHPEREREREREIGLGL
jgi:hypothetical protein